MKNIEKRQKIHEIYKFQEKAEESRLQPPQWLRGRAFASHAGDRDSFLGRDRSKSIVNAPLPDARQQVSVIVGEAQ